jgi:hypothetical protein
VETLGVGNTSTVDRIDYSNDTTTASVRGPLSVAKEDLVQLEILILVILLEAELEEVQRLIA